MAITIDQEKQEEYVIRAMAAYYRAGGRVDPSHRSIVNYQGRHYVYLYRRSNILAVFRIDNAGRLKRLKRWPDDDAMVAWAVEEVLERRQRLAA